AADGVEAGGEDDAVELERRVGRPDPGRGELLDRRGPQVDEADAGPVEGGVIAGVDAQALGADGVPLGAEGLGEGGVGHQGPDLAPQELGYPVVGREVE